MRFSLRSVRLYRQAIEERGVGDLSVIQIEKLPTEINPIAEAVNGLIQRLRREAPEGPLSVRAAQIEASLKELSWLSEKLLQLAKAEGGGLSSEVTHDLTHLLTHVVQDQQLVDNVMIELTLPQTGAVLSRIDPDAFAILVRNLIENALKTDLKLRCSLSCLRHEYVNILKRLCSTLR